MVLTTGAPRRSLGQEIADLLLTDITTGVVRPGERLPTERALMDLHGVGRNTVREAMHSLVALGVVDVRPGRGAVVVAPRAGDVLGGAAFAAMLGTTAVDDLYEFRTLLEVEAAGRAAERGDDGDHARIRAAFEAYERAAHGRDEPFRLDVAFHRSIVEASHNSAYGVALRAVSDTLVAVRRYTDEVPGAVDRAVEEHRQIAHYVVEGNRAAARAAMTMHLDTAKRTLAAARAGRTPDDHRRR